MPTYHEIMTTDLSTLTSAADRWEGMAKEFNDREKAYKRDVHSISMGRWLGLSADAANRGFSVTLKEFQNAQLEAKAIASLLRDAHTQFVDLRGKLRATRQDAIDAGMMVSDQGLVSYDTRKLGQGGLNALHHDPDYQRDAARAVRSWQDRIDQLVKDVDDADQGVRVAFEAVVIDSDINDGTVNGFNGKAQGDIEKYEAQEADEIANRVANGDKVSPAELAGLQRAFRDNSDDKAFSQTFLSGLGPDATIKFTNQLNDLAYDSDESHKDVYLDLQGGLANTVATATQVPGSVSDVPPGSHKFKDWLASNDGVFYRQWTEGLEKVGTKDYGAHSGNPLYGYQSFVSMMQHSDTRYDDQFLYQMGDDLIAAEKEKPGIFTEWGPGHDGIRADAIDGLLGVMSRNPDAATAFFDPAGNGEGRNHVGNNHLQYLVGSGDGTRDWPKHTITGVPVIEMDDPLSRTGLGAALAAAATGHEPLGLGQDAVPTYMHTPEHTRVMNGVISTLDQGTSTEVKDNLRVPIAQALSEYAPDTNEILGGLDGEYVENMQDGYFPDGRHPDQAHLSSPADSLVHVMRGLSEDPDAYGTLHKAESRYIDAELDKLPTGATGYSESNPLAKAGVALGTFTAIREDVLNDERTSAYSDADWKSKVAYHIIGGVVTPMAIPTAGASIPIGDGLQRGVDTWAWVWGSDLKADADTKATEGINDRFLDANKQMQLMVHGWGSERYDLGTDYGKDKVQGLTGEILSGHTTGVTNARAYLTDTTN